MKKPKKQLALNKVTLLNLDEPTLGAVAGGIAYTTHPGCIILKTETCLKTACV